MVSLNFVTLTPWRHNSEHLTINQSSKIFDTGSGSKSWFLADTIALGRPHASNQRSDCWAPHVWVPVLGEWRVNLERVKLGSVVLIGDVGPKEQETIFTLPSFFLFF